MKRILFCLMIIISMFAVVTVNSLDNIRIAVLDLEARGTSKTASAAVSEMLRTEMINLGMFTVIERNKMGVILKEQGFSQTGCTDQDCAVQVGKLLSARKILIGTLTQQDAEFLITVRVVDIEKGVAEFGEKEVASSAKLSDLNNAVSQLTAKLSARINGKRAEKRYNLIPLLKEPQEKENKKYTLKITSNRRDAEVYIDGVKAGIAPVTRQLDEGLYRVIVKKKGYSDIDRKIILNRKTIEKFDFNVNELKTATKEYKIGERGPAGGWIFYDKGNYFDGWRYLEAAPVDQCTSAPWGCSKKSIPGSNGTGIGTGKSNTKAIFDSCIEANIAVVFCTNYHGGGKSDWFLPSKDELNFMYINLHKAGVGGFANVVFMSSSEFTAYGAWIQDFYSGRQFSSIKDLTYRVRAVRAF